MPIGDRIAALKERCADPPFHRQHCLGQHCLETHEHVANSCDDIVLDAEDRSEIGPDIENGRAPASGGGCSGGFGAFRTPTSCS